MVSARWRLVVVVLALVAGCGVGESGSDGMLRVAVSFPPRAGLAIDTDDAFLLTKLGAVETLVRADVNGEAQPLLAESWTRDDPLTWTFRLRGGVEFQDGSPLTAEAVAASLRYVASSATPPRGLAGLELTAEPIDEQTVRVATDVPDPIVPLRLSSPNTGILAPSAYEGSGPPNALGTGTGPFQIVEYVTDQRIVLERFDGYWGTAASLAHVEVALLPDPASRVAALQAGEVDIAEGVPPAQLPVLRDLAGVRLEIYDIPRTTTLYVNTSGGATADLAVRRAIDLAVDRKALAEAILEGAATPAAGYFGPAVPWDPNTEAALPDPEAARQLLADAGYEPGQLRLWTYPARAELPELATVVQQMLAEAGIDTEIRVAEYNTLEPELLAGDYDLFLLSRSHFTDIPDAGAFLRSDFTCDGSYNLNRYCSPALDALLATLADADDPDARREVFVRAAQLLTDDVVGVPLLHDQARVALSDKVVGFVPDPLEQRLLTPELGIS